MKVWYITDGHGNRWNGLGFSPVRKEALTFYCLHCAGAMLRKLKNAHSKYPTPLGFEERSLTREEEATLVQQLVDVLPDNA